MNPRLTSAPDTRSGGKAMDLAVDANADGLHDQTFKWLATLPTEVRPIAAGRRYPFIVNRISELWSQIEYTRLHFQSLLLDRHKGRKGLPSEVRHEIETLQQYYFEHVSGLPAILWNAVPVRSPRIPDRAFAPHPDTMEIDISSL